MTGPGSQSPEPERRPTKGQKAAGSVVLAGLVLTSGALQEVSQSSEGVVKLILTIVAAVLAGIIPFTPPWSEISQRLRRLRGERWKRRLLRAIAWAVTGVCAVVLGGLLIPLASEQVERAWVRWTGCPEPEALTMAVSPEDLATARHLVTGFEQDEESNRFGCPVARIHTYPAGAKQIADALTESWSKAHLLSIGPQPDLWFPGAATYKAADNDQLAVSASVVATSPVVLAVPSALRVDPRQSNDQSDDDQRRSFTWRTLLDHARDMHWPVARPDPVLSAAGEMATVGMYSSLQGADEFNRDRLLPPARELEKQLGQASLPPGDSTDLFCRLPKIPAVAVTVTEQQMVRYNAGLPLGACGAKRPTKSLELLGFYPKDTLAVSYRLVRLTWTLSTPLHRAQAERFEAWLKGEQGKRFLNDAGLRVRGYQAHGPLSEDYGALPAGYSRAEPSAPVLEQMDKLRAAAQRPVSLLLALDASRSMLDRAGDGTRFSLAAKGLTRALDYAGPGDAMGLLAFQKTGPSVTLAEVGSSAAAIREALDKVQPDGGTPLYQAIVDGVAKLGPATPQRASALVVLTDGADSGNGIGSQAMLDAVKGKGVKVFVVVTGTANCANQAIVRVTEATAGRCFAVDADALDTRLVELFTVVWGGN